MTTAVNQRRPGVGGSGVARVHNRRVVTSDSDRPVITAGETALLAQLPTKFADKPWIVDSSGLSEMNRLVRPSSAAANLQSHQSYTSGLFDLVITGSRPVSGVGSAGGRRNVQRPKTGGSWFRSHGVAVGRNAPTSAWKQQRERRMTLTGVEPVSESNLLTRRTFVQQSLNADLKVKVRYVFRQFNGNESTTVSLVSLVSCLLLTARFYYPLYTKYVIEVRPSRSTQSPTLVTVFQPLVRSSLKITNRSFRHAAPRLWNKLPPILFVFHISLVLYHHPALHHALNLNRLLTSFSTLVLKPFFSQRKVFQFIFWSR